MMLPIFLSAITRLLDEHQELSVRCLLPQHIYDNQQTLAIIATHFHPQIEYSSDTANVLDYFAPCCAAPTKPGTVTLELALLNIPFVLGYKLNPLTYFFLSTIFQRDVVALPNLLLQHKAFPEYLQFDCTPEKLCIEISHLYHAWQESSDKYQQQVEQCRQVQEVLNKKGETIIDLAS